MHADMNLSNIFLDLSPQARKRKTKTKQMGLYQTTKLMHSERNHQQNKKTAYQIGEDVSSYTQRNYTFRLPAWPCGH